MYDTPNVRSLRLLRADRELLVMLTRNAHEHETDDESAWERLTDEEREAWMEKTIQEHERFIQMETAWQENANRLAFENTVVRNNRKF